MNENWEEFYELTKDQPPSPLLTEAIAFVRSKNATLDLGAGALKDTKFLLAEGFQMVTILDKEPLEETDLEQLPQDHVKHIVSSFEDFDFPKQEYDLINAQYSLPFCSPQNFDQVFRKLKGSLKPGGVFTGQFFGNNDEWSGQKPEMTFHTLEETKELLSDMEILELGEYDKDSRLADGTPKHWHVFNIIARRNESNTDHQN